ncbi:helix-turn-helix transcriptional regulator [Marivirga sp. S37H4]|uniref:Helix-turn-helix transcriptional regulator n=1 Tax=Marivirga aurantiaca TaxID=2802615 RepID=A0A934WZ56_9BACT|nr:helix-turn-helix transcriptional regulator [Marivirga aurantiaca]
MSIGDNIRKIRTIRGYSQQFLADSIGISQSKLNRIENGKSDLSVDHLMQICEVLESGFNEILQTSNNFKKSFPKSEIKKPELIYEEHIRPLKEEMRALRNQVSEISCLLKKQKT